MSENSDVFEVTLRSDVVAEIIEQLSHLPYHQVFALQQHVVVVYKTAEESAVTESTIITAN